MMPESLALSLENGTCPDAPAWELSKAVRFIADGIGVNPYRYTQL